MLLGFKREWRGNDAGIRTHALVALSSAMISTSALSRHAQVQRHGGDADPLRVIQGLAEAIGFIAAGTIFVAHGDPRRTVRNLTTAASIWLAASAGIVGGAAQFRLHAVAKGFELLIFTVVTVLKPAGLARKEDED